MMHAYIGWADRDGLKAFQPETESAQRRFSRNFDQHLDRVAVWTVLDTAALQAIESLLQAADYREAWEYLQSHSAYFGRLI